MNAPALRTSGTAERFDAFLDAVRETAERGRTALLSQQREDGHWVGELEGDTILESEFVLLLPRSDATRFVPPPEARCRSFTAARVSSAPPPGSPVGDAP